MKRFLQFVFFTGVFIFSLFLLSSYNLPQANALTCAAAGGQCQLGWSCRYYQFTGLEDCNEYPYYCCDPNPCALAGQRCDLSEGIGCCNSSQYTCSSPNNGTCVITPYCSAANTRDCIYGCTPTSSGGTCKPAPAPTCRTAGQSCSPSLGACCSGYSCGPSIPGTCLANCSGTNQTGYCPTAGTSCQYDSSSSMWRCMTTPTAPTCASAGQRCDLSEGIGCCNSSQYTCSSPNNGTCLANCSDSNPTGFCPSGSTCLQDRTTDRYRCIATYVPTSAPTAAPTTAPAANAPVGFGGITSGEVKDCPDNASGFNALCKINLKGDIISGIATILFILAVIVALIWFVWGGIRWIMSGGDKEKLRSAREHVIGAFVGLIIILLVYFIVNVVFSFFGLKGFNFRLPTIF